MFRHMMTAALAGSALAAIGSTALFAQSTTMAATAPGKPAYGSYGFDTSGMDKSVAPGDNFYQYANGTWAKNTPIPADKSNYGMFTVLDDLSKSRTKDILDQAKGDPNSKIGNAYAAYLDLKTVEAKGLSPIKPWLAEIKAVKTKAAYAAIVAKAMRSGVATPFNGYVGQDDKAPDTYIFSMSQGGLG
ncbi:MAG: M13 family peptidase, partial [Sphingobium sp.]|nr:M13 family peptidase [Sphingobium sp.]